MKFCPVVPEICRGQVHGPRKERRKRIRIRIRIIIIKIKIIIRNGAKTISLPTLFGRLNNNTPRQYKSFLSNYLLLRTEITRITISNLGNSFRQARLCGGKYTCSLDSNPPVC
jgi:hypothetical protein